METEEVYTTLIDGRKYIFMVKWDGFVWIARAILETGKLKLVVVGSTAEKAALNLVKNLEK